MPEIHPHQKTQTVAVKHESAPSMNVSEQQTTKVGNESVNTHTDKQAKLLYQKPTLN